MDHNDAHADHTGGRPLPSMLLTARPEAGGCRGGGTTLGRSSVP